jgi:hypothetical protein
LRATPDLFQTHVPSTSMSVLPSHIGVPWGFTKDSFHKDLTKGKRKRQGFWNGANRNFKERSVILNHSICKINDYSVNVKVKKTEAKLRMKG